MENFTSVAAFAAETALGGIAIALWVLATAMDIASTTIALQRPGTKEANPLVRWTMEKLGTGWVVVNAMISMALMFALISYGGPAGSTVLIVLAIARMFIAARNAKIGR